MHLLGRDIAMSVTYPDGRVEDLVKIPDWDFAWQNTYYFEKPIDLPKGSVVKVVAHYDNSASNPRNPNRPAQARHLGRGDHRRDVHRLHRRRPRRARTSPSPVRRTTSARS